MTDVMNNMTDDQIIAEFEELLGGQEPPEDNPGEPEDKDPPEDTPPEGEPEDKTDPEDGGEGALDSDDNGKSKHNKQAQAFYALRNKNKANEQLIQSLGSVLGFDPKASSDDIVAKVNDLITQKQAKDQGIPAEVLNRIQELEKQVKENEAVKHETKVTEDLALLAEKYNLTQEALTEFVVKLAENGKNPLEVPGVDLNAEYISMYFDSLIENAKKEAVAEEQARLEKINNGPGGLPGKGGGNEGGTDAIKSVSDLDKFFNSIEG